MPDAIERRRRNAIPSALFSAFPLKWGEYSHLIAPLRFAHRVDDKWDNYDDNAADDKDCDPSGWTTGRNLCRWDKAKHEGEQ